MTLAATTIGNGPRLVLLHGFTQNARCWGGIPERLAERFEVVLVDAPGHGASVHDDADLWASADLIAEVGGPATYIGYSMGGRMALHLALRHPGLVRSLVLVGATGGLDDAAERDARRGADEAIATRLDDANAAAVAGDLGPFTEFLRDWLAGPLFASLPESAQCRTERLGNRPAGLAASLRHCGTGMQEPLWDRLGAVSTPTVLVAGSTDTKFTALAHRLADAIGPSATVVVEPGSHAVHLEDPLVIERALAHLG